MTIIYEMEKRSDGLYQWRPRDGQWHIAKNLEEVISTIRKDAFSNNARFELHYIGRNLASGLTKRGTGGMLDSPEGARVEALR